LPIALESSNQQDLVQRTLAQQDLVQSAFWTSASTTSSLTADATRCALVGQTVADVERHLILDTLDHCLGNRTHAARILGISIRTLRNKLNEYMEAGFMVPEPGQKRPTNS
jgi:DNA-binding NtrC family response regulator